MAGYLLSSGYRGMLDAQIMYHVINTTNLSRMNIPTALRSSMKDDLSKACCVLHSLLLSTASMHRNTARRRHGKHAAGQHTKRQQSAGECQRASSSAGYLTWIWPSSLTWSMMPGYSCACKPCPSSSQMTLTCTAAMHIVFHSLCDILNSRIKS